MTSLAAGEKKDFNLAPNVDWCLTLELTRRRPELLIDNMPDPGGRVE